MTSKSEHWWPKLIPQWKLPREDPPIRVGPVRQNRKNQKLDRKKNRQNRPLLKKNRTKYHTLRGILPRLLIKSWMKKGSIHPRWQEPEKRVGLPKLMRKVR